MNNLRYLVFPRLDAETKHLDRLWEIHNEDGPDHRNDKHFRCPYCEEDGADITDRVPDAKRLGEILRQVGLVQAAALDDAEGYDGGRTVRAIKEAARILRNRIIEAEESVDEGENK